MKMQQRDRAQNEKIAQRPSRAWLEHCRAMAEPAQMEKKLAGLRVFLRPT
jgi:hypothetical protein